MAYASAEGGYRAGSSVFHLDASHLDQVSIPDAELLFTGDFKRHGPDLILTGHDGRHHIIPGYFSGAQHPALVAPNGASLSAELVDLLAGSPAPGQYAQAQPTTPADAIGKVEKVIGNVVVVRNGVAVALNVGDAVYKSDIIQTATNAECGIDFPDGTALNLIADTRMALNDYSYDPNGNSNDALFSLVQGTFAFVAGKVAHTGDMKIETPVATMGIRGTTGSVQEQIGTINANIGNVTYSFAVVEDYGTGHLGQYELIDSQNNVIATVSQSGFLTFVTPQGPNLPPLVTTQPMTNSQLGFEQQIIQQVFQVLNSGNNPNPQSTPSAPGSSTPPDELHNLPQLLHDDNGTPLTINVQTGDGTITGTATVNLTTANIQNVAGNATASSISFFDGTSNFSNNLGADYFGPQINSAGSTITLTNNMTGEYGSWFSNHTYLITSFTASFDYQATGQADGIAFVLQDDPRGGSALGVNFAGNGGSGLGYAGISPSVAVELNIYDGHVQGTNFATNGSTGTYNSTGNVHLDGNGDVIQVVLSYDGSVLTETLTDLNTGATYSTSYTENLSAILGSDTAYVGFTGGTGAAASTQIVSNFTFESDAAVAVDPTVTPGTLNVIGNVAVANPNSADIVTASFSPEAPNYAGTFSLDPVTESNGTASVGFEFNLGNDQINLGPGQVLTQSYAVALTNPQNPAVNVEQTISISIGGPGHDNFVFAPGVGADTIVNFNPQVDTIELDNFANIPNVQQLASLITTDTHGNAMIELGHNDSVTVPGMTASYLQAHLQSLVHLH